MSKTKKSDREAFEEFHRDNPGIYRELVEMARYAKGQGATKLGLPMLWEALRWKHKAYLRSHDNSQGVYGLNNLYKAHYARLIMEQEPDLEGIFETRVLKAADTPRPLYNEAEDGQLGMVA